MTEERFQALNDAVQEILRKQADLEERLARVEAASRPPVTVPSPVAAQRTSEPPHPVPAQSPRPAPPLMSARPVRAARGERPAIESKVGLTLVNRIGVITLVLGVAFFFKWAVDN